MASLVTRTLARSNVILRTVSESLFCPILRHFVERMASGIYIATSELRITLTSRKILHRASRVYRATIPDINRRAVAHQTQHPSGRRILHFLWSMLSNPADPPKIDWEQYKKLVPVPGLVEKFQSAYTSFKIPYPEDKLTAAIEKQWTELQPKIAEYCETQKQQIAAAEKEIAKINALPKYEDMTMEMVRDLFPESALDPVNRPTLWPHTEDEQLGYVDPTARKT